jgi:hypothetical protein
MANEYQSSKLCEALYTNCEEKMDQLQVLRLPSMAKFNAGFLHCNQSFEQECVGPSKTIYERRMKKVRHNPHILMFLIPSVSVD